MPKNRRGDRSDSDNDNDDDSDGADDTMTGRNHNHNPRKQARFEVSSSPRSSPPPQVDYTQNRNDQEPVLKKESKVSYRPSGAAYR